MSKLRMSDAVETRWWDLVETMEAPAGHRVLDLCEPLARASHAWTEATGWVLEGTVELPDDEPVFLAAPLHTSSLPEGWRWRDVGELEGEGDACPVDPRARGLTMTRLNESEARGLRTILSRAA